MTKYKSPPAGQEISCVMQGIDSSFISKKQEMEDFIKKILIEDKFEILGFLSHSFTPQGFTLLFLLSESHLAVHTYSEYNSIYFNMYSCRGSKDAEKTFNLFKKKLNPKKILFLKNNIIPVK
jgi:S-adenosylmethionine decarboxylase